ncbi:MAG TPA: AAA family ATPase, partial [bacterium]|nr:AAA family ATPase [bacterium]
MADSKEQDDVAAVQRCEKAYNRLRDELSKVIVGQSEVIEQVLVAMFARGHALLEGVPGLAKTLLISSLAKSLHLTFKRIQFTPDLMPSDVTGTEVIQEDPENHQRAYKFLPGPVFANMLLADEINRTPPKTQAAMLEAMQERQVSAGGKMHMLPNPFFVLATQNPLEQEGTYPLPEAQLDRFLLYIKVDYPSAAEEWEVARRVTTGQLGDI